MLIVDSREPESVKKAFDQASIQALKFGDFSYTHPDGRLVLIERKEPSDLVASIIDGRLMRQVAGMVDEVSRTSGQAYLLICGFPTGLGRIPQELVDSILIDCQMAGCVVLTSGDYRRAIIGIIRKSAIESVPVAAKKKIKSDTWQMSLLKCLPGVGHKTAKLMLTKYGSLNVALAELLKSKEREYWNE